MTVCNTGGLQHEWYCEGVGEQDYTFLFGNGFLITSHPCNLYILEVFRTSIPGIVPGISGVVHAAQETTIYISPIASYSTRLNREGTRLTISRQLSS